MSSHDPRIDAYIERAAPFAQDLLRHWRATVHAHCPDVVETIKWGFPNFVYRDKILSGMAAFKAHCSIGFWHGEAAVGEGRIKTQPGYFSLCGEGLNVGRDSGEAVTEDYPGDSPWPFVGGNKALQVLSNQHSFHRYTRGVHDECCLKACSYSELEYYCSKPVKNPKY